MRLRPILWSLVVSLVWFANPGIGEAAVTASPAYVVGTVPLPAVGSGDVAVSGTALLVGEGAFGAGTESIIRLQRDGSSALLVTGLNALGGLAYDRSGDRLLFTDNGAEIVGATTGDTVYALGAPLSAGAPVPAAGLALAPAGTIPFAQAVVPLPGGSVLVGDAAGSGAGRVVQVTGATPTTLIGNLDYTAGISLTMTAGGELLVGNVDSGTFEGSVLRFDLTGAPTGVLASGLSGSYDSALDPAGNLLVTGGFTGDFSSSTVIKITPTGTIDEIASGYGFSTGLDVDAATGQIVLLDFGATHVDTLTPVDGLTPGGRARKECQVEMWGGAPDRSKKGVPKTRWSCTDGAACDRDGVVNGSCTYLVGGCFTVTDPRAPACIPAPVDTATISSRQSVAALADLQAALDEALPSTGAVCSRGVPVVVTADKRTVALTVDGTHAGKRADKDTLKLRCLPPGA